MDNRKIAISIIVLLFFAGLASAFTYSSWVSRSFKIGDGYWINLNGQGIGNGSLQDVTCISGCTGFGNGTFDGANATNLNASNITTGTLADARLSAAAQNFNSTYTYLLTNDGTTTYAKNGRTNNIDYSGSSATVLQSVFTAMTSGGQVFIKSGNDYNLASTPELDTRSNIVITGDYPTLISSSGNVCIRLIDSNNVTISRLKFNGNAVADSGVQSFRSRDVLISENIFTNFIQSSINLQYLTTKNKRWVIEKNHVYNNTASAALGAIYGNTVENITVSQNHIQTTLNHSDGIYFLGALNIIVTDNQVYDITNYGIDIDQGLNVIISNNRVLTTVASSTGISLAASNNSIVMGNTITAPTGIATSAGAGEHNFYNLITINNVVSTTASMNTIGGGGTEGNNVIFGNVFKGGTNTINQYYNTTGQNYIFP